jgi:ABC-type transporter MlaC component
MPNISNPTAVTKPLDFDSFESIANDSKIKNDSSVEIATEKSGRIVIGLAAKSPFTGRVINLLGKPVNLSKISDSQRNGVLATQAFKQALVQRYGQTIANAVDKHLLLSKNAGVLTAGDLRKNLKVTAAIVRLLQDPANQGKQTAHAAALRSSALSQRSTKRDSDGSLTTPSAPPRSRSASTASDTSSRAHFANREDPPAYRSTEDLRPTAPARSRSNSEQSHISVDNKPKSANEIDEIDEAGNRWHHVPIYISAEKAHELAGESASLPEEPSAAKEAQRPRSGAYSAEELEAKFKGIDAVIAKAKTGNV